MFKLFKKSEERKDALDTLPETAVLSPATESTDCETGDCESIDKEPADKEPADKESADKEPEDTATGVQEPGGNQIIGMEQFRQWADANIEDESIRSTAEAAMETIVRVLKGQEDAESFYELIVKGADYDRGVAEAAEEGEIRGRNARIEEERSVMLETDGVPHPGTGGNLRESNIPGIFRIARGAL